MKLSLFAFNNPVGSLSNVIALSDGSFAVAQITTIRNAGVMDYDDAGNKVMEILRNEKKLDRLRDRVTKFHAALRPGISLTEQSSLDPSASYEAFDDVSPRSVLDATESDTAVVNALFSRKIGEISEPVRGREAYYVLLVESRTIPTEQEFALRRDEFTEQLTLELRRPAYEEWLVREREKAEIRDFRSE
jgi:hypothetical protein